MEQRFAPTCVSGHRHKAGLNPGGVEETIMRAVIRKSGDCIGVYVVSLGVWAVLIGTIANKF